MDLILPNTNSTFINCNPSHGIIHQDNNLKPIGTPDFQSAIVIDDSRFMANTGCLTTTN